jgi:DNA-binding LytR/AlgR family response regulator
MRILIIEDEIPASTELVAILNQINPLISIEGILQTKDDVQQRLASYTGKIDLIFMDIHLQGENILASLPELKIPAPIIFVTGYDEYLADAFCHTSLDYILKPINKEKIQKALARYSHITKYFRQDYDYLINQLSQRQKKTRTRILLKKGMDFHFCRIEDVAYFYSEFKLIFLFDFQGQKHLTDFKTLTLLEEELDPSVFYRANRRFIININAIKIIKPLDRVKLTVELTVKVPELVIISQENASSFKNWVASQDDLKI